MNLGGWRVISGDDGESHIMPVADTQPHQESSDCHCRPFWEMEACAYVHNSFDGREAFEEGERKVS